jgi:hypothetical protein
LYMGAGTASQLYCGPYRRVRVRALIVRRGALFPCGHRCFAPSGRGGEDPCFGAAERRRAERACFARAADFLPDVFFRIGVPPFARPPGGKHGRRPYTLRDFARTHRAHARASYGGRIA